MLRGEIAKTKAGSSTTKVADENREDEGLTNEVASSPYKSVS